jgi:hypothetical protein
MFRLILMLIIALSLLPSTTLGAQAGDRPPTKKNETGPCTKTLAKNEAAPQNLYESAPEELYAAALRALEELKAKAESQLGVASDTIEEDQALSIKLLIKALRDRANEVLSASEDASEDASKVPKIVLKAFELARELESLQSPLSSRRLGSTWLQTIVPIDTPRSVLYEDTEASDTPSSVRRIEILAAKELLLYRGQQLVSTLYGAIYLLSYNNEGDVGVSQPPNPMDRKRLEFHKVDIPPKPSSQRAKKMRITELSNSLWEDIPEPTERQVQILVISDSIRTTIPLAAATAARRKAERNEKEAAKFPDLFWKFVSDQL